ncbi:hypothetical protein QF034_004287 [Streptomyces africanus]|uniref:Uncharacterized protein n=1 Tax=Streptomyces africanus TaxID=231024 RepID=A0ABU0QRQ0_9ACTN|nr:hypothetical protein [Streptomyces africanus]
MTFFTVHAPPLTDWNVHSWQLLAVFTHWPACLPAVVEAPGISRNLPLFLLTSRYCPVDRVGSAVWGEVPALAGAAGVGPLTGGGADGGGGAGDLQVLAADPVGGGEAARRVRGDRPLVVEGAVVVPLQDLGAVGGGLVLHAQHLAAGHVEDLEVAGGLLDELPLLVGGVVGILLGGAHAVGRGTADDRQHQMLLALDMV